MKFPALFMSEIKNKQSRKWYLDNTARVKEYEKIRQKRLRESGKRQKNSVYNPYHPFKNPCGVSCFECPYYDCIK